MYTVKILYQDKEGFIKMAIFYHIQNITIKEEDISLQDDDGKIHHYNYCLPESTDYSVSRHGGSITVIDIYHGNSIGTARKHGVKGNFTTLPYAIAYTCRNGDNGLRQ